MFLLLPSSALDMEKVLKASCSKTAVDGENSHEGDIASLRVNGSSITTELIVLVKMEALLSKRRL